MEETSAAQVEEHDEKSSDEFPPVRFLSDSLIHPESGDDGFNGSVSL